MTDQQLITAAIEASGLSARRFATHILTRDERTIRRWIAGDIAIPDVARDFLERWLTIPSSTMQRVVAALNRE